MKGKGPAPLGRKWRIMLSERDWEILNRLEREFFGEVDVKTEEQIGNLRRLGVDAVWVGLFEAVGVALLMLASTSAVITMIVVTVLLVTLLFFATGAFCRGSTRDRQARRGATEVTAGTLLLERGEPTREPSR